MHISCTQECLAKGLAVTSHAVPSKASLPVLSHVLLEAVAPAIGEGRLRLVATNLDLTITRTIPAQVEATGGVAVPARLMADFVNTLPDERIVLKLDDEKQILQLRCGSQTAKVKGLPAHEFPVLPAFPTQVQVALGAKGLRALLDRVAFAAATEDSRPILTGVLARFDDRQLTLAGADGFRLSVEHTGLAEAVAPMSVVIPARALLEMAQLCGEQVEPVVIEVNADRTQVRFSLTNVQVTAQLIQGVFPDIAQIVPQTYTSRAVVTCEELRMATRMVSAFVDRSGKHNGVSLEADPIHARLIVVGAHAERGHGVGEIDAAIEGDAFRVSLQAPFLLNLLERIPGPQVSIEYLRNEARPAPVVVRSVGEDGFLHVMMPMAETRRHEAPAATPAASAQAMAVQTTG